jgi:ABC-type nitrate/sulfonate/bicarbonate transport system ATPase subunit
MTPVVEVRGLRHTFGGDRPVPALDGVDLAAAAGRFVSIVGPSGCGKSTLLRVLAGLLVPTAGVATVHGESVVGRPGAVAYLPQRDLLLPWRRALGNAALGAEIAGVPRDEARRQAAEHFAAFGLEGFERAWPSQLSGGMRQRLALLRTYLPGRDVLLLDEPFGALDAITRRQLYGFLQEVWLHDRRTTLLVTHDVEEALFLSDEVHVMTPRPGRIHHTVRVPEARPRPLSVVASGDFVAPKAELLAALEGATGQVDGGPAD